METEELVAILAKHTRIGGTRDLRAHCNCGWHSESTTTERSNQHRAHVAQMVFESDWLRERDAAKWDEGRDVGHEDTYLNLIEGRGAFDAAETPNPYRADRIDAEDGGR